MMTEADVRRVQNMMRMDIRGEKVGKVIGGATKKIISFTIAAFFIVLFAFIYFSFGVGKGIKNNVL